MIAMAGTCNIFIVLMYLYWYPCRALLQLPGAAAWPASAWRSAPALHAEAASSELVKGANWSGHACFASFVCSFVCFSLLLVSEWRSRQALSNRTAAYTVKQQARHKLTSASSCLHLCESV